MSLTKEELLKPRYMVIAIYPFNDHFMMNEVIELNEFDDRIKDQQEWYVLKHPLRPGSSTLPLTMHESTFNNYPHLFRKLEWWEHREVKDMPDKVVNPLRPNNVIAIQWSVGESGELLYKCAGDYWFKVSVDFNSFQPA